MNVEMGECLRPTGTPNEAYKSSSRDAVLALRGKPSFSTPLLVCENDCDREGTGLDPHFWRSRNQFSFAVLLAFRKRMTSENGSHYERFALSQQIANVLYCPFSDGTPGLAVTYWFEWSISLFSSSVGSHQPVSPRGAMRFAMQSFRQSFLLNLTGET